MSFFSHLNIFLTWSCPAVFSRREGGCEVRLWATAQQKAQVLGPDCSSRIGSSFLLPKGWCDGAALGWKSNHILVCSLGTFFKGSLYLSCVLWSFDPFAFRKCLECVCIRGLGAGLPSELCWCLEMSRWALSWCSLFLLTVCHPERAG